MYKLQLDLFETVTDKVFEKPTVIVPKFKDFGAIVRTPSEPAPIISNSYLNGYYSILGIFFPEPDPGLKNPNRSLCRS